MLQPISRTSALRALRKAFKEIENFSQRVAFGEKMVWSIRFEYDKLISLVTDNNMNLDELEDRLSKKVANLRIKEQACEKKSMERSSLSLKLFGVNWALEDLRRFKEHYCQNHPKQAL